MGSIIRASCACGFSTEFFGGSRRGNHHALCMAPARCNSCRTLQADNYLSHDARCPACGAAVVIYNAPGLQAGPAPAGPHPTDFALPRSGCRCPACGSFNLYFEPLSCCE